MVSTNNGDALLKPVIEAFRNPSLSNGEQGKDGEIQRLDTLSASNGIGSLADNSGDKLEKKPIELMSVSLIEPTSGLSYRFGFIRTGSNARFDDTDIKQLENLVTQLRSAIAIHSRFADMQNQVFIGDETASLLGFGMVVLTASGYILTVNSFAEKLLQRQQEFLRVKSVLHLSDREGQKALGHSLHLLELDDTDEQDCCFQVPCVDNAENSWVIQVLRYKRKPPGLNSLKTGVYSVIIKQKSPFSAEELSKLFSFTPAEAQLAKQLVQGESLTEAAETLCRSRSTVRAQLAAIFDKTGVHKQHQLISHILHAATKLGP
jgi:DNA-binding CsgD family transcriptional regulator